MSLSATHVILMLVASVIVTPPIVLLVPHARQSPLFDRLLWAGTFLTAFLGTWLGIANWSDALPNPAIDDVPVLPIFLGALGGAFVLNALLWILDHMEHPAELEDAADPDGESPPSEEGIIEPDTTDALQDH